MAVVRKKTDKHHKNILLANSQEKTISSEPLKTVRSSQAPRMRRRMKRDILVRGGILIACILGLGAGLLIQAERRYSLQRKINTLQTDIKQLQADNETYQNELDFVDIPKIKEVGHQAGLRATHPDQVVTLDFAAWATTNYTLAAVESNDLWTPTITPPEKRPLVGTASEEIDQSALENSQEINEELNPTNDVKRQTPAVETQGGSPTTRVRATAAPTSRNNENVVTQPEINDEEPEMSNFDAMIPEADSDSNGNISDEMVDIMEETE